MNETKEIPCPVCGSVSNKFHIPVWENVWEWDDGDPPDFIGCTECETMLPYQDWLNNRGGGE